MQICCFATVQ